MKFIATVALAAAAATLLSGCVANSVQELQSSEGATHVSTHKGSVSALYPVVLREMEQCYDGRYIYEKQRVSYALLVGNPQELLAHHVTGNLDAANGRATITHRQDPKYPRLHGPSYHMHVVMVQKGPDVEVTVSAKNWVRGSKHDNDLVAGWINGATGCSLKK